MEETFEWLAAANPYVPLFVAGGAMLLGKVAIEGREPGIVDAGQGRMS